MDFLDKYLEDLDMNFDDSEDLYGTFLITSAQIPTSSDDEDDSKSSSSSSTLPVHRSLFDADLFNFQNPMLYGGLLERGAPRSSVDATSSSISIQDWDSLPRIEQPEKLNIKLFPHQLVSVYEMEKLEKDRKIEVKNSNGSYYITDFGILGDDPGMGKSFSIVSLILRDKMSWDISQPHSSTKIQSYGESLRYHSYHTSRKRIKTSFILASPNLIEQWKEYFSFVENGTLSIKEISTVKDVDGIIDYKLWDVLLVSSARYNELMSYIGSEIVWKRFIFDDAASTYIPNMRPIRAGFTWFVSATYHHLKNIRSKGYIKDFFKFIDTPILEHLVIRNPTEFCKLSFKMPQIREVYHICEHPRILHILDGHIDREISLMIGAGDIKGAITRLGAGISSSENLVEIVSKRHKEKLLQAKNSLSMWSFRTGSQAEKEKQMWSKRVEELEKLINELDKKYKEILNEECTICCDMIKDPVVLPCCQNIFCGNCVLTWLKTSNQKCPLCRTILQRKDLIYISMNGEEKQEIPVKIKILPKHLKTVEIIKNGLNEDPQKRFLIFSNYDESFNIIRNVLNENNMRFGEISGQKSSRDLKIKNYKDGKFNILFLNSRFNGAGIKLQETTDIILYHEMAPNIRTQNVGRAMRIGKTTDLTIHNLVFDHETSS